MLSFILFIVPIFLIYLRPRLSPDTNSCSFRLRIAGYQKGAGKNTPRWPGVQRASTAVCAFSSPDVPCGSRGGAPLVRAEGRLGPSVFGLRLLINLSGLKRWERGRLSSAVAVSALLVERPRRDGAGSASSHGRGFVTVKIKGNGPLGVGFEHPFCSRSSC